MEFSRNALVLSGGNVKGAYQAGAIKALFEHTFPDGSKFEPDGIYGVSVGSMNGGFLADRAGQAALRGEKPDWPSIGQELEQFWRTQITSFASIGKKRSTLSLIAGVLFGKFDGLTTMDGAAALARANIRVENLEASKTYYACGVTDMASGDYLNCDVETYGNAMLEYVIASTREPVTMPLMWVNNQPLADGGVRMIAPLSPAIKRGCEKLAVIAMKPEQMSADNAKKDFSNILKLLGRTIGILTSSIMNNDLDEVRKVNRAVAKATTANAKAMVAGKRIIEFVEVRPDEKLSIDVRNFTSKDIKALIDLGEQEAKKQLAKGWLTGTD